MSFRTRLLAVLVGTVIFLTAVPRVSEAVHPLLTNAAAEGGSDLLVTKTGPSSADANSDVSFTINVTNLGPDAAPIVTLKDVIPAGLTFVSVAETSADPDLFSCSAPSPGPGPTTGNMCSTTNFPAGASRDFTLIVHVSAETAPGTTFTNVASVIVTSEPPPGSEDPPLDPNEENNSSGASFTTAGATSADLSATKSAPSGAAPNSDVPFTIVITNAGPDAAANVSFSDTLPGNMTFVSMAQNSGPAFNCTPTPLVGAAGTVTCTLAIMNSGASASFTLTAHIPPGPAMQYDNTVTVSSTAPNATPDPNPENDTGQASVQASSVDVSMTKAGPATAFAGNPITWLLTLTNEAPNEGPGDTAIDASFVDQLPSGTTFVSLVHVAGAAPSSCSTPPPGQNGTVSCTVSSLAAGFNSQYSLTANISSNVPTGTVINNTATATSDSFDPNITNNSSTAATTVTNTIVNQPPDAVNDELSSVAEDSGVRTISIASLLANDSAGPPDESGQTLTFSLIAGSGMGGTVTSDAANVYFTPTADFNGTASFQYTVTDNGTTNGSPDPKSDTATVSFTITEINDAPTSVNDTLGNVAEDSGQRTISIASLLSNDSKGPANESGQTLTLTGVSNPAGGTVTFDATNVYFTPTADYNGPASFQYTATDNGTTSGGADPKADTATVVSFTVTEVNDAPTAVSETIANSAEDSGPRTILAATLTANDSKGPANENGQTLIIKTVSNPVGGTVSIVGGNVIFTPTADYFGPASFQYTVEDNGTTNGAAAPLTSGPATASFTITEVNDTPDAVNDALSSVAEDSGQRTIPIASLLGNDSRGPANESGQTLTLTGVSNPIGGTVSSDATNVYFTPAADYNGPATFQYTVTDNGTSNGAADPKSDTATVSFTVTEVNDAPTAVNDPLGNMEEDAPQRTIPFSVLTANDSKGPANESGQTLIVKTVSNPVGLTVSIVGNTVRFTPLPNYTGPASFRYTIEDNGTTNGVADPLTSATSALVHFNITDQPEGVLRFSAANYSVAEGAGFITITVERTGDTSQAVAVDYASSDHSNPADFIPCTSPGAGLASSRCDFTTALGTLRFAAGETTKTFKVLISQDNYVEGPETLSLTLSNATGGAVFGVPAAATLEITDDVTEGATNPIDNAADFVRALYHDMLNREPDGPGLAFWTDNIEKCNDPARRPADQTVAQCLDKQRESTAIAFFVAPEFQMTGGFVYLLYKGSLTGVPNYDGGSPGRFPTYLEFIRDVSQVSEGIVVNNQISGAVVEANRNRLAAEFVLRPEFVAKYGGLDHTLFVQELFNTTGIAATAAEKQALVDGLTNGTETKASVLRKVVDGTLVIAENNVQFTTTYGQAFYNQEFRRVFVYMEYAGFLRRNPDAAGFIHWLGKLNQYNGDPFAAEMVKAFILSPEYRSRFGQP